MSLDDLSKMGNLRACQRPWASNQESFQEMFIPPQVWRAATWQGYNREKQLLVKWIEITDSAGGAEDGPQASEDTWGPEDPRARVDKQGKWWVECGQGMAWEFRASVWSEGGMVTATIRKYSLAKAALILKYYKGLKFPIFLLYLALLCSLNTALLNHLVIILEVKMGLIHR